MDMTDTVNALLSLAIPAITALAGAVVWQVLEWLGLKKDSEAGQHFEKAVKAGLRLAMNRHGIALKDDGAIKVEANSQLMQEVLTYVNQSVPGAVNRFKMTEQQMQAYIEARMIEMKQGT